MFSTTTGPPASSGGKDLYQHLDYVYREASQFCVIFISAAYVQKAWTRHELRSAQARAFDDNREYILPVRLDDTEVPGLPKTVGYVDLRDIDIDILASLILTKLQGQGSHLFRPRVLVLSHPFESRGCLELISTLIT